MAYSFSNTQIADLFDEILAVLILQNEDRFRIRAYENAVAIFRQLQEPLEYFWQNKLLNTIPGIGTIFAKKIDELFTTGKIAEFDAIRHGLPDGMFGLLPVEGIGPKNAFKFAKLFQLTDRSTAAAKLLEAARSRQIRTLEGFGEKSETLLIENLTRFLQSDPNTRIPLYRADQIVAEIGQYLATCPDIETFSPLGSHRRRKETVGDIDIGITTHQPQTVSDFLVQIPKISQVVAKGEGMVRLVYAEGIAVDFKIVDPKEWGSLLQHFTGSKSHNVALREMAVSRGLSMSEHGMKIKGVWQRYADEAKFYRTLGLDYIPPELRENQGEIEAAQNHRLPTLVSKSDLKGDLHTHTNFGWVNSHDAGLSSVDELAEAAIELGYEYLGIGDHNPSLSTYSEDQIVQQIRKRSAFIEQIKNSYEKRVKKSTIKLLNTLEIDIRSDGKLAVPDQGLALLDYAVVSIHSTFKQNPEIMTDRLLRGLSHPKVKILGHPTGRLIGKRDPISANWDTIFKYCARHNKAIEINSSPDRLDLPDILVKKAIGHGVKLVINTDSHHQSTLSGIQSGVDVARRGWATPEDIINTWPSAKLLKWLSA